MKKLFSTLGREDIRLKERMEVIVVLSMVQVREMSRRQADHGTFDSELEAKVHKAHKLWRKACVQLRVEEGLTEAERFRSRLADFEEVLEYPDDPGNHWRIAATGLKAKKEDIVYAIAYLIGRIAANADDVIIPALFRAIQLHVRTHTAR